MGVWRCGGLILQKIRLKIYTMQTIRIYDYISQLEVYKPIKWKQKHSFVSDYSISNCIMVVMAGAGSAKGKEKELMKNNTGEHNFLLS